jgi:CheY-like chemotaxis protein
MPASTPTPPLPRSEDRLSVLVVDDDPIQLRVLRDRLLRAGYSVITRDSTLGTSGFILEHKPDLVLLDLGMPALGGAELAMILRRHGINRLTGVILHSGLSRNELERLRLSTGALGAIQKNGDEERFLEELNTLVSELRERRSAGER